MAGNKLSERLGKLSQISGPLTGLALFVFAVGALAYSAISEAQDYETTQERYDINSTQAAKSAYGRWGDGGFVGQAIERTPEVVAAHYYISHHAPVSSRPGHRLRDISLVRIAQRCYDKGLREISAQIADHKIVPKAAAAIGIALFAEEFEGVKNAQMLREFAKTELEQSWGPKDKNIPQDQKDAIKAALEAQFEAQNIAIEL